MLIFSVITILCIIPASNCGLSIYSNSLDSNDYLLAIKYIPTLNYFVSLHSNETIMIWN